MIKYLFISLFFVTSLFAENSDNEIISEEDETQELTVKKEPSADCLILQDENSIICKFEVQRVPEEQSIVVQWIDPQGDVSRSRNMIIPASHGSIYDYRYIKGRMLGNWIFKVILDEKEYTTQFELKAN